MIIKVREYRTYTTTKTFEYTLDVPDKETAIDRIAECDYRLDQPIITGQETYHNTEGPCADPPLISVETGEECEGRTSWIIEEDGTDGDELYTWF